MFDVSSSLVYKIKNGKKWSWLTNKQFVKNTHTRSKLTEDDAKSIFYHAWAGKLTHVEIGAMFNISKSRITDIKYRKAFKNTTQCLDENAIPNEYL